MTRPARGPGARRRAAILAVALALAATSCGQAATVDDPPGSPAERPDAIVDPAPETPDGPTPDEPGPAPLDPATTVEIFGPDKDSPGALIPLVLTAHGAARDAQPRFAVEVGGVPGTCAGASWAHGSGVSQACWVRLPTAPGTHDIRASVAVADGQRRSTVATYAVDGRGEPAEAVDEATRDRITSCGNETAHVWLTFDDGFTSTAAMRRVLDALGSAGVRGRFFGTGQWARANPGMVAELRAAGHLIGNHTATHEWLNAVSDEALDAQVARGPRTDTPALLRPGFGSGAYTTRVSAAAARHGLGVCYWTVDPRDWAGPDAATIVSRVMGGDHRTAPVRPGGVVLLHMTGTHTAEALPRLITEIRAAGLTLDPLD